jgi:aspartyl aminopeptidase
VIEWCRSFLEGKGFKELQETANWQIEKGHKYFFTKNNSTMVAFHVGESFDPSNTGDYEGS